MSNKVVAEELPQIISEAHTEKFSKLINAIQYGARKMTLNWENTTSVTPSGHAMLMAFYDYACEMNVSVDSKQVNKELKKNSIVNRLLKVRETELIHKDQLNYIDKNNFIICVEKDLDFNKLPTLSESLRVIISELISNSIDHSTSERFYVYISNSETDVSLGVLDMGVSIPAKLNQKFIFDHDYEYIEESFKKGITTRRLKNGGSGLTKSFQRVKELNGRMAVLSRKGQVRRYFKNRRVDKKELKYSIPGTWFFITIPK